MESKEKKAVEQYTHEGTKRPNNPPVGLVTLGTDPDQPRKSYDLYDPRMDPQLQWSGKNTHVTLEVETVSLHVHERIDPHTILEKTMRTKQHSQQTMFNFFDTEENNLPLRDAIDFYKHNQGWSNRLIAGDSLLVMNSLLEKERMEGKVQMIYMDPPYGIKYGSNFQPFVSKKTVTDGRDNDLTQEPETIKAFRDTWELGIHSYLSYLRDRLVLAKRLLSDTGSIFVQISDENLPYVRNLLIEIFSADNFVSQISFKTSPGDTTKYLPPCLDYIVWYAKDKKKLKYRKLFLAKEFGGQYSSSFDWIELPDGSCRVLTTRERKNPTLIPAGKIFRWGDPRRKRSSAAFDFAYRFDGQDFSPGPGMNWKTTKEGLDRLNKAGRLGRKGDQLNYKRYLEDFPYTELLNVWTDTVNSFLKRRYVVETNPLVIQRCLLMSTDPGDLVLDVTCGSGNTAFVAEKFGRRWITCDTSRIAIALARQKMLTSHFKFYKLQDSEVSNGFEYRKVPHISLQTIVRDEPSLEEILCDDPLVDSAKIRISGPFTVEAVPSPVVRSVDMASGKLESGVDVDHTQYVRQRQWRDELLRTGIRGKSGQRIEFSRMDTHPATKWLHADAETKDENPKRVMISFGPEHAPLERRQVEQAIYEAGTLVPKPSLIIFTAMQFDPEAAKDIDELNWPGVNVLKAEINKDLLINDLKKKRSTNESFWLVGQPDVDLWGTKDGKYVVKVRGFDYYNTHTDEIESGDSSQIAMWMLDTDYDGRSVYPQQFFFPMDGDGGGWSRLAKTLRAQIDEDLIAMYRGIESLPFEPGPNKRVAIKIIDDRGIESLKIIDLE